MQNDSLQLTKLENFLKATLKKNTLKTSTLFSKRVVRLDKKTSFDDLDSVVIKKPFLGFYVHSASDVEAEIKINVNNDFGDSFPVVTGLNIFLNGMVDGAQLSFDEQAGKSITIYFFHEPVDSFDIPSGGGGGGGVSLPTNFISSNIIVNEVPSLIFDANGSRKKMTIHNRSANRLYYGQNSEVSSAPILGSEDTTGYKNICSYVESGEKFVFENIAGLWARSDSDADILVHLFEEF